MKNIRHIIRLRLAAGIDGAIQEPEVRRAIIINVFSAFGLFSMTFFFILGLTEHRWVYSVVLSGFIALLVFNLFYLQLSKNVKLTGHIVVSLMVLMEFALLLDLGEGETALLWYYLFPVLSFFILGRKTGLIYITILIVPTIAYLIHPVGNFTRYEFTTVGRFIFTFTVTSGMIYVFELIRSRTYQALVHTNAQKTFYLNETLQQKEEILVQSEKLKITNLELEKLSVVASETTNAIKIVKPNGIIEWINRGFTKLYGYSIEELEQNFNNNIDLFYKGTDIMAILKNCVQTKKSCKIEVPSRYKTGGKIWVQITFTPILDEHNKVVRIISIDSDITLIKQAEAEILQRNEEINAQKEALSEQNAKIELQHDMIKGSIRYAKKIQSTILPNPKLLDKYFNWAVLFKPRDIVSGDFYWFTTVIEPVHKRLFTFTAVVDCTGHGVPGAFMSLIASRLLNEIINERMILDTAEVLTRMNKEVRKALRQDETDNNDGMDMVLVRIEDTANDKFDILVSGAKRNLIYFDKSRNQIDIVKVDRKGLGGKSNRPDYKFKHEKIELEKQSILYLLSDGLTDQNNSERKRFGTKRLMNYLTKNKYKTVNDQKMIIDNEFLRFKEAEDQRDDICMLFLELK